MKMLGREARLESIKPVKVVVPFSFARSLDWWSCDGKRIPSMFASFIIVAEACA